MARGDYGPEIRSSLGSGQPGRVSMTPPKPSPGEMIGQTAKGMAEGRTPQQNPDPAAKVGQAPRAPGGIAVVASRPPGAGGTAPPDLHHVAAAASIAHAILNRSGGGNVGGGP